MNLAQIATAITAAFKIKSGGPSNVTRAQPVRDALLELVQYINDNGLVGITVNAAAVPAAKRIAVADAIIASVQGGGQAMVLESDGQWLGKFFKDNRVPAEPAKICCEQEVNPDTGTTEIYWNRYPIA